jgi:CxxC-x17-CxxC domain-containing protein
MHNAICSECGKKCKVPFKPTGDKPVFCADCFGSRANERDFVQSKYQDKRMHLAICAECGNKCEVPFRPTPGKPIYCKTCFRKSGTAGGKKVEQFKEQFEKLHAKLDTILKFLASIVSSEETGGQRKTSEAGASEPKNVTKLQTKRKASPQKTVKKKAAATKTITKKAKQKSNTPKAKKTVKKQTKKAVSSRK